MTFGHLVLRTNQLVALTAWYGTVLEARIAAQTEHAVFLTYDTCHHRLALVDDGPIPEARAIAHAAFAHPSTAALCADLARIAAAGIEPHRAVDHGVTASFYFRDPDGNVVELYADTDGALDGKGTAYTPSELVDRLGF